MKKIDLEDWQICNPDHRQDHLPQPYRLINQVLSQTILYQLSLKLYEVQQKRKDKNYQGSVKQYYSQNTLEPDNISTLSSSCNTHNHLLAGDKAGNLYLLDLAKKTVFNKKQLVQGRRVIHIAESYLTDGDVSFTTVAAVLNGHNKIYILRYRHDQPKLVVTHEIKVAANCDDPSKLPYYCQFQDYSRILIVYTYSGSILGYRISEIPIDLDAIQRGQTIPLQEEELKKKLRYPLNYANIETQVISINQSFFEIKFPGKKKPLTEQQILSRLNKKVEVAVPQVEVKKDPKKKQQKKEEKKQAQAEAPAEEFIFNESQPLHEIVIQHGNDNTPSYSKPHFSPFFYVIHSRVQLQKKKSFQKGRYIDICERVVYGWTNTRFFYIAPFLPKKANYYSNFIYVQHFQQKITQQFTKQKQQVLNQKVSFNSPKTIKNVSEITATSLSQNDEYFAAGMSNGVTTVWTTNSINILLNTVRQQGAITQIAFFEKWKLITGTSKGQIQIDNLLTLSNQVKRTIIFESKIDYPITSIKVSELGLAFALDTNSNVRVFDLWRNEKICKLYSCNSFAAQQSKAKRWISSPNKTPQLSLYTNNDFTVLISTNWPNYTPREIQESKQKTAEINKLIENPWKCSGTNVHVMRNFQFLITLFEGLETIYKKGYDRKKVQNLFSNLEFTQLYDRNFDIPDFGVTNQAKKTQKGTEKGFGSRTKTFVSSKSKQKLLKDTSSLSSNNAKPDLTNVVLHPQKFLLQRRKIGVNEVITNELLQTKIREGFKRQGALQNMLMNDISKGLV